MTVANLLPPVWSGSFDTTHYTLAAWPSLAMLALFAVGLFATQQLSKHRTPEALSTPVAFLLGLVPALALSALTALPATRDASFASGLFANAVLFDALLVFLSTSTLGAAVFFATYTPDRRRSLLFAALVPLLSTVLLAMTHARWIDRLRVLPFFQCNGPGVVHAQRPAQVSVTLFHRGYQRWFGGLVPPLPYTQEELLDWTVDTALPLGPSPAGEAHGTVRAQRGILLVETTLSLHVASEQAHPGFPLRVGNEWNFSIAESTGEQVLLLIANEHTERRPLTLRISEATERDGLRSFTLTTGGTEPLSLVAVDGQTMLLHGQQLERFLSWEQPPTVAGPTNCEFRIPERILGQCDLPRGTNLAGPVSWTIHRQPGIATPIMMLLTAGILIPRGSTIRAQRLSTLAGPPNAPEAPAAPWSTVGVPDSLQLPVPVEVPTTSPVPAPHPLVRHSRLAPSYSPPARHPRPRRYDQHVPPSRGPHP